MSISEFLREHLSDLEMSQADLARELTLRGQSTTRANVGHWIAGRHEPPLKDAEFRAALASALEMDVNEMMSALGFAVLETDRSREALRAADIIDQLPSDAKSLALDYLDLLARRYTKTN